MYAGRVPKVSSYLRTEHHPFASTRSRIKVMTLNLPCLGLCLVSRFSYEQEVRGQANSMVVVVVEAVSEVYVVSLVKAVVEWMPPNQIQLIASQPGAVVEWMPRTKYGWNTLLARREHTPATKEHIPARLSRRTHCGQRSRQRAREPEAAVEPVLDSS